MWHSHYNVVIRVVATEVLFTFTTVIINQFKLLLLLHGVVNTHASI